MFYENNLSLMEFQQFIPRSNLDSRNTFSVTGAQSDIFSVLIFVLVSSAFVKSKDVGASFVFKLIYFQIKQFFGACFHL